MWKKSKFKVTVYFVTSVHKILFNIVKNINKHKGRGAYNLQNLKRVGQSFYILTIFILKF